MSGFREDSSVELLAALSPELGRLYRSISSLLCEHRRAVPYHGWPHVKFVATHGYRFARTMNADAHVVCAAALVHDLNYIVKPSSRAVDGVELIRNQLLGAGFFHSEVERITSVVLEADLSTRGPQLSGEAACLSDADSLFKVLPTTPILLAKEYLHENSVSLRALAQSIVEEQGSRLELGYFFYTHAARSKYEHLATASVDMWRSVLAVLEDTELCEFIDELSNSVSASG